MPRVTDTLSCRRLFAACSEKENGIRLAAPEVLDDPQKPYPNVNSSARGPTTTRISAQSFTTQSAPAARTADSVTVVVKPITLAPAALPARTPAGASSTTMHSAGENPSTAAPFK